MKTKREGTYPELEFYYRNKERKIQYQRDYRKKNAERELQKQRAYQQIDAYREAQKRARVKQYGLTVEEYDQLLTTQGGRCAICDRVMKKPHIDHDHSTGRVRGLLCRGCNQGLGQFEDDTDRLLGAVGYLRGGGDNQIIR